MTLVIDNVTYIYDLLIALAGKLCITALYSKSKNPQVNLTGCLYSEGPLALLRTLYLVPQAAPILPYNRRSRQTHATTSNHHEHS